MLITKVVELWLIPKFAKLIMLLGRLHQNTTRYLWFTKTNMENRYKPIKYCQTTKFKFLKNLTTACYFLVFLQKVLVMSVLTFNIFDKIILKILAIIKFH
jgi:hypothetical protein